MSECPNCGADMKHSPCCGRVDTLRARVEELERFVGDSEIRSDYQNAAQMRAAIERLTTERDDVRRALSRRMEWLSMHEERTGNIVTLRYDADTFKKIVAETQAALTRHADGRKEKDHA